MLALTLFGIFFVIALAGVPLLYALLSYDFLVLYPINPATAKRYRDAFVPSGAKDDPMGAHLIWELLVKHRDQLGVGRRQDPFRNGTAAGPIISSTARILN